eukprot:6224899-Ditylum_brightwellii.AAC.1
MPDNISKGDGSNFPCTMCLGQQNLSTIASKYSKRSSTSSSQDAYLLPQRRPRESNSPPNHQKVEDSKTNPLKQQK